jgi:hypothetical protein
VGEQRPPKLRHVPLVDETPSHPSKTHAAAEVSRLPALLLRAKNRWSGRLPGATLISRNSQPQTGVATVNVLLLTVFIGVVLVLFFIVMFLRDVADPRGSSERDALLPLASEKPRPSKKRRENSPDHSQNSYDQ